MKILIFDGSNIIHRTFFVHKREDVEVITGMALHSALMSFNKWFRKVKPDKVVIAFDKPSWRKFYTESDNCVSKKIYKANRHSDMSPSELRDYKKFLDDVREFQKVLDEFTTLTILSGELLEADDLIAGVVQEYKDEIHEKVIITTDTDMLQLKKYPNTSVISPATEEEISLEKFNNDPEYYMFQKCFRGDPTDNVQSAYPRVQSKKLLKAYYDNKNGDSFDLVNLLKFKWTNEKGVEMLVEDLYNENRLLMDLECQSENIRNMISTVVNEKMNQWKKYNQFQFLRFLGRYELKNIIDDINSFQEMLSKR